MTCASQIVPLSDQSWNLARHSIVESFAADPMMRWMVPNDADYLIAMPEVFESFARPAAKQQTAFVARGGLAVAVWLPPGVESDSERMSCALSKVVRPEIRDDVAAVFGAMGVCHSRASPCWYLPIIGVHPSVGGMGLGTALMEHALLQCDATAMPAYLDSSNARNIPFYERVGFNIVEEIQSGQSPRSWAMERPGKGS